MAFPLQFLLETALPNLLMAKDKKKHSKKDKASEDVLEVVALSIKKFRKVTKQISKLSTGQKLVGGIALAAAGLVYLAAQEAEGSPSDDDNAPKADEHPEEEPGPAHIPVRKSRKSARTHSE